MNEKVKWFVIQAVCVPAVWFFAALYIEERVYIAVHVEQIAWASKWVVRGLWLFWAVKSCREAFWFEFGASEVKGADGEVTVWTFKHPRLTVVADFGAKTVRIQAKKATWCDKQMDKDAKYQLERSVDATLPMLDLTYKNTPFREDKSYTTYATGVGTGTAYVGGQTVNVTVPVSIPTGGGSYSVEAGRCLAFNWRPITRTLSDLYHSPPFRNGSGGITASKKMIDRDYSPNGVDITVSTADTKLASKFDKEWKPIYARIEAMGKAIDDEMQNVAYLAEIEQFEAQEAAAKEKASAAAAAAEKKASSAAANAKSVAAEFLKESGMEEPVSYYSWNDDGALTFLLAHDKQGNLLVRDAAKGWHGKALGASAKILHDKGGDFVEVEVRDKAFEQEHLSKRRFNVLRGFGKDKLVEWMDKINILGGQ